MVSVQVKSLLEAGTFLQKSMLATVMDHLGKFIRGCGLSNKYNKYILSVLTFISKCVGVNEHEFESMVLDQGLSLVVYNLPYPPSKMPQDQAPDPPSPGKAALLRSRSSRARAGAPALSHSSSISQPHLSTSPSAAGPQAGEAPRESSSPGAE